MVKFFSGFEVAEIESLIYRCLNKNAPAIYPQIFSVQEKNHKGWTGNWLRIMPKLFVEKIGGESGWDDQLLSCFVRFCKDPEQATWKQITAR